MEKIDKIQQAGEIQNEALEIYRICTNDDSNEIIQRLYKIIGLSESFIKKLGD